MSNPAYKDCREPSHPEAVSHEPARTVSDDASWILQPRIRTGLVIFLICIAVASAITSIGFRDNDFNNHYKSGVTALTGVLDHMSIGEQYMPGRFWQNAMIAIPPYRISRAIFWLVSIVATIYALRAFHRMANVGTPIRKDAAVVAGLLATVFMLPLVFRDLDDCGLHLLLMAMIAFGGLALVRHQVWLVGFWVGLAITYKTTPLLILGYLLYKRRWVESLSVVGFLIVFNVIIPAVVFGPTATYNANLAFVNKAYTALTVDNPTDNPVEPPKHQNFSFKMAVSRFLLTFPPEHTLFLAKENQKDSNQILLVPVQEIRPSPGFVQFLDLSNATARRIITLVTLLLAGLLAWRFRHGLYERQSSEEVDGQQSRHMRNIAPEWAAVCLLCTLMSPVAWKHHYVLALPAMFLVVRQALVWPNPWYRDVLMWLTVATMLPLRELMGRHYSVVYASYNVLTAGMLVLLGLVLTLPTTAAKADKRVAARRTDGNSDLQTQPTHVSARD